MFYFQKFAQKVRFPAVKFFSQTGQTPDQPTDQQTKITYKDEYMSSKRQVVLPQHRYMDIWHSINLISRFFENFQNFTPPADRQRDQLTDRQTNRQSKV